MKFLLFFLLSGPFAHPPVDPLAAGDRLFFQMKYAEAIEQYQANPASPEAQWKTARSYICLADVTPLDRQKPLYYQAVAAARACLRLDQQNGNGHTWLGAALGNIANYEGSRTKVRLCTEIKGELERALALNPGDDVALSILGSFYRALGNINWLERTLANTFLGSLPKGGFAEGEAALRKAIQLSPNTLRHWYELGLLYQDWGKDHLAWQTFQSAQGLPVVLGSDRKRLSQIKRIVSVKQPY
ncbi:MAG: hypothetical protein H7Z75_20305 [Ferruginibacter sp.]|nr:hypothetical protein [Cytophagales bacterium]